MDKARIILGATTGLMTLTNTTYAKPVSYMDEVSFNRTEIDMYNCPIEYLGESEKLFSRLNEFMALDDNWDGTGAISPLNETIENVKFVLDSLRDKYLKLLDIEDIVPSPYGTISLYFEDITGNEVSIEIGKDYIGLSGEINGSETIIDDISVHEISLVIAKISQLQPLT